MTEEKIVRWTEKGNEIKNIETEPNIRMNPKASFSLRSELTHANINNGRFDWAVRLYLSMRNDETDMDGGCAFEPPIFLPRGIISRVDLSSFFRNMRPEGTDLSSYDEHEQPSADDVLCAVLAHALAAESRLRVCIRENPDLDVDADPEVYVFTLRYPGGETADSVCQSFIEEYLGIAGKLSR